VVAVIRFFYLLALLITPLAVVLLVFSSKMRRQFFRLARRILPYVLVFYIVARLARLIRPPGSDPATGGDAAAGSSQLPGAAEVFIANPPPWLVQAASLLVGALVAAALVYAALALLRQRERRKADATALVRVARQAQQALDQIQSGADLRNTVIRCYAEMSQALRELRGIQRSQAMTAREFELALAGAGLPAVSVRSLTRMFEAVRYGPAVAGAAEERQARDSLQAILTAIHAGATSPSGSVTPAARPADEDGPTGKP
jgi:hypothetical protein